MFGFEKGPQPIDREREEKIARVKKFLEERIIIREIDVLSGAESEMPDERVEKILKDAEAGDFGPAYKFLEEEETSLIDWIERWKKMDANGKDTERIQKLEEFLEDLQKIKEGLNLER